MDGKGRVRPSFCRHTAPRKGVADRKERYGLGVFAPSPCSLAVEVLGRDHAKIRRKDGSNDGQGGYCLPSAPAFVQIASLDEDLDFAVGDGAFEHPEAAIGMDPADTLRADDPCGLFNAPGDLFRGLDMIDFDIDDTEAELNARIDFLEGVEVAVGPMGQFKDEKIGVEAVEKIEQGLPLAGLDGLAAVVAETEMDRFLDFDPIEDPVDGGLRDGAIFRAAGDVRLVDLNAVARKIGDLLGKDVGDGEGEFLEAAVMIPAKARHRVADSAGSPAAAEGQGGRGDKPRPYRGTGYLRKLREPRPYRGTGYLRKLREPRPYK